MLIQEDQAGEPPLDTGGPGALLTSAVAPTRAARCHSRAGGAPLDAAHPRD